MNSSLHLSRSIENVDDFGSPRPASDTFCTRIEITPNTAAIEGMRADSGADIELRQSKYLNNIVEQDHQAIKRIRSPAPFGLMPLLRQNLLSAQR